MTFFVSSAAENSQCKFKSDYFSEFDLNPVAKTDGSVYATDGLTFRQLFEFNVCETIDGTEDKYARMTILETSEEVEFGGDPSSIEPYLEPYGTQIFGSRGDGHVHGVRLTYASDHACTVEENYSLTIAVECHDWYTG